MRKHDPIVRIMPLIHEKGCEQGSMIKTALKDDDGNPAAFALVYNYGKNVIYFRGYCSHCGAIFEESYILESLLVYPEVS